MPDISEFTGYAAFVLVVLHLVFQFLTRFLAKGGNQMPGIDAQARSDINRLKDRTERLEKDTASQWEKLDTIDNKCTENGHALARIEGFLWQLAQSGKIKN